MQRAKPSCLEIRFTFCRFEEVGRAPSARLQNTSGSTKLARRVVARANRHSSSACSARVRDPRITRKYALRGPVGGLLTSLKLRASCAVDPDFRNKGLPEERCS